MYPVVNFVLAHAALGDMLCCLPAIIRARKEHPEMKLVLWVQEGQRHLIKTLLAPYGDFTVCRLNEFNDRAAAGHVKGPVVLNSVKDNTQTRNRMDMVDFGFIALLDAMPNSDQEKSYPTSAPLGERVIPERYIVMATGYTAGNRVIKPYLMQPIIEWAVATGRRVVVLGSSKTHAGVILNGEMKARPVMSEFDALEQSYKDACLDLRDKTHLEQARDVIGYADAIVGLDGGLLHLAGTTMTPIVYGMTHVRPEHRSIWRAGSCNYRVKHVTPRDLGCAGCQSNWTLVFGHSFTECAYGDFKCIDALHPQDFIKALGELARD
jgi:hypothetical protein